MVEELLKTGKIGNMTLKNRLMYSAMSFDLRHQNGQIWDCEIESLMERAKSEHGPALINFPGALVAPPSAKGGNGHLYIYNDESMLSLRRAVERVKINGCKTMIQCGGGATDSKKGPSDILNNNDAPIKGMTVGEIEGYVEEVARGARLCHQAGFDALEIHAGTGKLLSTFLSPYTNQRTDDYGGSSYNRARIIIDILKAMRREVGEDMALTIKLSVDDLAGYLTIDEGKEIAKHLAPYLDAIQPSVGFNEFKWTITPAYFYPDGYMLEYTQAIKEVVDIPVIAMGKLSNPVFANKVLADGKADFVALGRPLFADPNWLTKAAKGETDKIVQCISCVNCFTGNKRAEIYPTHRSCTVNPTLLREKEFCTLKPTTNPQKILVVGGGLAGAEAGSTLARRGHDVTLCEKNDHLGGQWAIAAHDPEKREYRYLIPRQKRDLESSGAKVHYNTTVDKAYIEKMKPDVVVLATGAVPKTIPISNPNIKYNVVQGNDVIMGTAEVGQNVVVIGGRFIGMEAAIDLAKQGKKVSVVDVQNIGQGTNPRLGGIYRNRMVEEGVYMYPSCPIRRFTDNGIEITHMNLPLLLEADTVVMAVGTKPDNALTAIVEEMNITCLPIGDCKRIGDALFSIRDGAEVGRMV